MKRIFLGLLMTVVCTSLSLVAHAQFGGALFKRPNITDIFKPVVGAGAAYDMEDHDGKKSQMEMTIVGKETFEGKDAYWFEMGHFDQKTNQMMYAKMLVTKDDFQFHKMIIVMPGTSQPMEMPFNPSQANKQKMEESMEKWRSVGTETITVPAGTFVCDHWTKEGGKEDVWVSSKISPMGMVKQVSEHSTMTLTKVITDAKDHITGTPVKFDPRQLAQQMMEQRKKP